ncbi:MAG: hypothetical protein JSW63_09245 [Ignavibacterium sp.]|nr:MAG: hypothetical protein JSW63_09245 [Ignavibacterium sp.]
MIINQVNQACGYFVDGEFVTFDSPGCLLRSYDIMRKEGGVLPEKVYFADFESSDFILSGTTHFLLTSHLPTVMNSGVLCFKDKNVAQSFIKHDDEMVTDWMDYRVLRGTPDKIISISITPDGMQPEVIVLSKNDIVEYVFSTQNFDEDISLYLKGYDELENFIVPATGEELKVRMFASRPGAGFPFLKTKDDSPVGMVKILGAHTSDEEEM